MSVNKVNSDGSLSRVAGGTLYADSPIGTILAFGGADAPAGWMICDGTSLLRASYPELFAVIGTSFGAGDGSTTFNLPDMRESVPKGAGLTGHTVGAHLDADGLAVGEFLDDRIQEHNHGINFTSSGSGNLYSLNFSENKSSNYNYTAISNARGRKGATTEVKSVGVNYIIKAKMVALPADFMNAINDVLEVSKPVSATNTEYTTNGSIIWKRSGNVVEVTFLNVAFASQTSGDVTLATGLPPSNNYSWSVIKSLVNVSVQQGVAVNTNGSLTSIGGSTGGSSYYDSFTYLAAN